MKLPPVRLIAGYYALLSRLGKEAHTKERLRQQQILHPEEDAETALTAQDERKLRLALASLLGGLLLSAAAALAWRPVPFRELSRPGYGEAAQEEELTARLGRSTYQLPVTVESRLYTQDEWDTLCETIWAALQKTALAENPDWQHIRTGLALTEETGVPGVSVSWDSSEPEWIDYDGTLGDSAVIPDGQKVTLTALLEAEGLSREYAVTAVLRTDPLSETERTARLLQEQVADAAADRREAVILLPEQWLGQPLTFLRTDRTPPVLFFLLGLMLAAAFWLLPGQRRREEEQRRSRVLAEAYPELVSTLTVLLGAGLTVRGAWERMVLNYRRSLLSGGPKHALYEEMWLTLNSLGQGSLEETAYTAFGRRCGQPSYLRLGNLLESNLKLGSRGLIPLMKEEAEQALETRLRNARKQGEEISSRMLLPMLLLFVLVLVILMVPAFLSF